MWTAQPGACAGLVGGCRRQGGSYDWTGGAIGGSLELGGHGRFKACLGGSQKLQEGQARHA